MAIRRNTLGSLQLEHGQWSKRMLPHPPKGEHDQAAMKARPWKGLYDSAKVSLWQAGWQGKQADIKPVGPAKRFNELHLATTKRKNLVVLTDHTRYFC